MQEQVKPQVGVTDNGPARGLAAIRKFLFSLSGVTLSLLVILALYPGWHPLLRWAMVGLFAGIILTEVALRRGSIVCRCLLPLLIGTVCVEAYILIHELGIAPELMKYFVFGDKYNEVFYSATATLYAIITALALVKGIEDFDATKKNISDEAYQVRAIFEMTHYFGHAESSQTHQAANELKLKLATYAINVASMRDQHIGNVNRSLLRQCQRNIARLVTEDENDRYALRGIMRAHAELGALRSRRINSIGEKIPRYLIWALWLMAAGLVLPFMAEPLMKEAVAPATGLIPNDARFGQYTIIFLLAALNSFLLVMLSDISDPFDGFWQINMGPFHELSDSLDSELEGSASSA